MLANSSGHLLISDKPCPDYSRLRPGPAGGSWLARGFGRLLCKNRFPLEAFPLGSSSWQISGLLEEIGSIIPQRAEYDTGGLDKGYSTPPPGSNKLRIRGPGIRRPSLRTPA